MDHHHQETSPARTGSKIDDDDESTVVHDQEITSWTEQWIAALDRIGVHGRAVVMRLDVSKLGSVDDDLVDILEAKLRSGTVLNSEGYALRALSNAIAAGPYQPLPVATPAKVERRVPACEPSCPEPEGDDELAAPANRDQAMGIWTSVLGDLQLHVSRPSYETWLRDTAGDDFDGKTFTVSAPNTFIADMLEQRMFSLIQNAVRKITDVDVEVAFVVRGKPVLGWECEQCGRWNPPGQ